MDNNSEVRHRNCPLCLGNQRELLSKLNFPLFEGTPISGSVEIVDCKECGFIYYDTPSTRADFDAFYQDHYLVHAYNLRNQHPAESAYLAETVNILLRGGVKKDALIVDVGCGPGHLLARMQSAGFNNVLGIELCTEYVKHMNDTGIPAKAGSATDLPLNEEKADCIIFKNIFEHFYDFAAVLDQMEKNLAADGFVLVEVPDADRYNDFVDYNPLSYFTLEHINHFDNNHLQTMFQRRGFETIATGTRMLDIAEKFPVLIQHGLFRRHSNHADKEATETLVDANNKFALSANIREWLSITAAFESAEIDNIISNHKPIHIWGLSYRTLAWLGMSKLNQSQCIAGFYDSDHRKQQRTLKGKPILPPELLIHAKSDETVIIGVGPSSESMKNILINDWGFTGNILILR